MCGNSDVVQEEERLTCGLGSFLVNEIENSFENVID